MQVDLLTPTGVVPLGVFSVLRRLISADCDHAFDPALVFVALKTELWNLTYMSRRSSYVTI